MTTGKPQAKDIPDLLMLRVVRSLSRAEGVAYPDDDHENCYTNPNRDEAWTMVWDVEDSMALHMPEVPDKVVRAKLATLADRGLLDGCDCGCRGDWYCTPEGLALDPQPVRVSKRYPAPRVFEPEELGG